MLSNAVAGLALYLLMDFERRQNLVLNFATAVKYLGAVLFSASLLLGVVTIFPPSLPRDIVGIVSLGDLAIKDDENRAGVTLERVSEHSRSA